MGGIRVVLTAAEEDLLTSEVEALLEEHPGLAAGHSQFHSLLGAIARDLEDKRADIKAARGSEGISPSERRLAKVQVFLLAKYLARVAAFRRRTAESLANIGLRRALGEDVERRVAEHEAAVVKMRRRVKSLVDVTDKYSVPNIFTSLGVISELGQELRPQDRLSRSSEGGWSEYSSDSRDSYSSSLASNATLGSTGSCSPPHQQPSRRRLVSFHCIADTVAVLTRTYNLKSGPFL